MKVCLSRDVKVIEDRGDEVLVELIGTGVRWVVSKEDLKVKKEEPDEKIDARE